MKLKFYIFTLLMMLVSLQLCLPNTAFSQSCTDLTATYSSTESRCTATGSVQINATGGSGTYNYRVQGPVSTAYTSSNIIGGLESGSYTITVKDIVSDCTFKIDNVMVPGTYSTPLFGLTETDVSCTNGTDGTISVAGLTGGLAPFTFMVVAPSPMSVGATNSTGSFGGLSAGTYAIQMMDSCGGLQTRTISIQNYSWLIYASSVTPAGCTLYNGQLTLRDSKGNFNTSGSAFTGFQYGVVTTPGDTTWSGTDSFSFDIGQSRTIALVAKDRCGLVQSASWSNTSIPSLQANVSITAANCSGFNASVMGSQNLTNPTYCLVDGSGNAVPGQPCNATGAFTAIPYGSYCINMTNSCYDTVITRCFSQVQSVPAITGAVALSNYTCTGATATVTGQHNLTNPQYCLFDNSGNPVGSCNSTGVFSNIPFGSYSIQVTDGCTGAVLPLSFSDSKPVPSVDSLVTITGNTCSSFNAAVTGATNLSTPQYCLVNSLGISLGCNSNGVFNNLAYGDYCINITDACSDTSIQRCIHATSPSVTGGSAGISNKTCNGFTVTISGQANVFSGLYCLQDTAGNPVVGVPCNTTGVFTNVPFGSYCVKTTDGCSGSTNTVCFTVTTPVQSVGAVQVSNETCAGFTATQTGQQNLSSPVYCVFDSLNNSLGCNSTGVFVISYYGSFTMQTTDGCSDSVFKTAFSAVIPVPSVSPTVNFSNQTCSSFSAAIAGQTNLTNPHYYLKDNTGTVIDNNNTGAFYNIAYGSYCIDVLNGCSDTTIERCFTLAANAVSMSLTAKPSCQYNTTDLTVNVISGFGPYNVAVYDNSNNLIMDTTSASSNIVISGLPSLIVAESYKVILSGSCGTPDTSFVMADPSTLTRTYNVQKKCPSSITPSGSGDINVVATTNLSAVNVSITQMNFSPASISYSYNSGANYTFSNLDAGTYVLTYSFSSCSATINDTVTVPGYTFPDLGKSAAYQCDNNSFSVGAAATGGISPFTYQIIGSEPSAPSVNSAPQSSPIFSINNGTQYSLIRLRAIDACGNAALNDIDILPLQNTVVSASLNCIYESTTLSINTLPNATYTWYLKTSSSATDSTLVGTDSSYTIPYLTTADTGVYVSRMSLHSGCLTKVSYFHLDGSCNGMFTLPLNVQLTGTPAGDGRNLLTWNGTGDASVQQFMLQRNSVQDRNFVTIGTIPVSSAQSGTTYSFEDDNPLKGTNFYRLDIVHSGNISGYSNIISLSDNTPGLISVYPNPVTDQLNINIQGDHPDNYVVSLYTTTGQLIYRTQQPGLQTGVVTYTRGNAAKAGLYLLKVYNSDTGENHVFKVTFK